MSRRPRFRNFKGNRRHKPLRFWPEARRKPFWRRYLPLWGGAIAAGTVIGFGWAYLPEGGDGAPPARTTSIESYVDELDRSGERPKASPEASDGVRANFSLCHTGGGYNCVVDGDTIWLEGQNIRIADIDAPETHEPRCTSEKELGDRATQKLHQLVNSGTVTLDRIDRDRDGYGRLLRIVKVDGVSVGETLVDEGFARWYAGGRRPWC